MRSLAQIAALAAAAFVLGAAGSASAEVVEATPGGFAVKQAVEIDAAPHFVWSGLTNVGRWWNKDHSWSGDARNLTLDPNPNGCFCEKMPGKGGAAHMRVIFVSKNDTLRMEGGLGPLAMTGASGHLIWKLEDLGNNRTRLTQTYDVGGYAQGGLADWAPKVDFVLTEQINRFKKYMETGSPQ